MACHICGAEAVDRCYSCGKLFCTEHGNIDCDRCRTGIAPGDRRADRISARPLRDVNDRAWWRPQQAEDYNPPACHVCQGLARYTCRNCEQRFCAEHAHSTRMCKECGKTSLYGLYVLGGLALVVVVGLVLWGIARLFGLAAELT